MLQEYFSYPPTSCKATWQGGEREREREVIKIQQTDHILNSVFAANKLANSP